MRLMQNGDKSFSDINNNSNYFGVLIYYKHRQPLRRFEAYVYNRKSNIGAIVIPSSDYNYAIFIS